MFNIFKIITDLQCESNYYRQRLRELDNRVHRIESPPKYVAGQKVFINENVEVEILGIDNDYNGFRAYFIRYPQGTIKSISDYDLEYLIACTLKEKEKEKIISKLIKIVNL